MIFNSQDFGIGPLALVAAFWMSWSSFEQCVHGGILFSIAEFFSPVGVQQRETSRLGFG